MKPSRWTLAGAVIAIVAAAAVWVSVRAEKPFATEVAVESGALAGVVGDGVLSFKGVPFAAPPTAAAAIVTATRLNGIRMLVASSTG